MSRDLRVAAARGRSQSHSPTRTDPASGTASIDIDIDEAFPTNSLDTSPAASRLLQRDNALGLEAALAPPTMTQTAPSDQTPNSVQAQIPLSEKSGSDPNAALTGSDWRASSGPRPIPQVNQTIEEINLDVNTDTGVWYKYVAESMESDKILVENWNLNMDVILIFAGLFSGILTAFIIEFYRLMKPEQDDITAKAVIDAAQLLRYMATQDRSQPIPSPPPVSLMQEEYEFQARSTVVWLNALWFTSLALSLGAAVAAMVVKQWLQFYLSDQATGNAHTDAIHRQYRYNALHRWKVPTIISILPLLLHTSVGLFLAGLIIVLWDINQLVGIVVLAMFAALAVLYTGSFLMPLFDPSCPYKSTGLELFRHTLRRARLAFWFVVYRTAKFLQPPPAVDLPHSKSLDGQTIHASLWEYTAKTLSKVIRSSKSHFVFARDPTASADIEQQIIEAKQVSLDIDSILWLVKASGKQNLVDMGLMCIAKLKPDPKHQVEKCLRFNIQSLLIQKAKARVLGSQHNNWKNLDNAVPQDLLQDVSRLSVIGKYMQSLMFIWHDPSYFDANPPQPISDSLIWEEPGPFSGDLGPLLRWADFTEKTAPQQQTTDPPQFLLGNLLKLWRRLVSASDRNYGVIDARGWQPDVFALVICTEAHYYQMVKDKGGPGSLRRADNDDPCPWSDLHTLVTEYTRGSLELKDETLEQIIDTYTYIISKSQSSHILLGSEALLPLLKLLQNRVTIYDTVLQKLIFCLSSFKFEDNAEARRKRARFYWQNGGFVKLNRTKSYEELCAALYHFITERSIADQEDGSQNAASMPSTPSTSQGTTSQTLEPIDVQIYRVSLTCLIDTLHEMDKPLQSYNDLFIGLSEDSAKLVIDQMSDRQSRFVTEWQTPEAMMWLVDLLFVWVRDSSTSNLSYIQRDRVMDILGDLLCYEWQQDLLDQLCSKILPFWVEALGDPNDSDLANIITFDACHTLRSIFHRDKEQRNKAVLFSYIEYHVFDAIVALLGSDHVAPEAKVQWAKLRHMWKADLLEYGMDPDEGKALVERREYDRLKATLPIQSTPVVTTANLPKDREPTPVRQTFIRSTTKNATGFPLSVGLERSPTRIQHYPSSARSSASFNNVRRSWSPLPDTTNQGSP